MRRRLRVVLIGVEQQDLDALRLQLEADDGLEIAGATLLSAIRHQSGRAPDSVDAVVMSPAVWTRLAVSATSRAPHAVPDGRLVEELTARERDVLGLVAEGRPNREIALRLGISEHTVKFHLASLFGKLQASTRTQAVRRALEWGLIDL